MSPATRRGWLLAVLSAGLLLAACGSSEKGSTVTSRDDSTKGSQQDSGALVGDGPTLVATLGDSITAGTPLWDPDPAVRDRIDEPDHTNQWQHWAALANPQLQFRNCGVNRQRTDEIAARLADCLGDAKYLVVQGGINDIAQGRPADEAEQNLRDMVRAGKQAGATVLLTDVLPWNAGYPDHAKAITELNRRIATIAEDEDVRLLNFYTTLEDPDKPGRMRKEWTIDGSHPSPAGHRQLGERAFALA